MRTAAYGLGVFLVAAHAQALGLVSELAPPVQDVSSFGYSLSLSGTRLLIGDPNHGQYPNFQRGATWVYEAGASGFAYQDALSGQAMDQGRFGADVALDGDVAIATEPGAMKVFLFQWSAGAWNQQAVIDVAPLTSYAVDISGDTAVIGRDDEWNGSAYGGAVHVERQSGSAWSEETTLFASDPNAKALGQAVALDGDTLVAGAPSGGATAGNAFVFVRSGTTWTEQTELTPSSPSGSFGTAVALDGDTLAVGDPQVAAAPNVYVFVRSGTTWSPQATLSAPVAGNSYFGKALALSGDRLVVGAPQTNGGFGAAYLYERSGTTWGAPTPVVASDTAANDHFGTSVSIDSTHVAVGAPDHGAAPFYGSVYVYDFGTPDAGSGGSAGAGGASGSAGATPTAGAGGVAGASQTGGSTSGGSGGSVAKGGSAGSATGGSAARSSDSGDSGGCGCHTRKRSPSSAWLLILVAMGAYRARRRPPRSR